MVWGLVAEVPAGGYISIAKAIVVVVILLAWARLLTWMDKDAEPAHLPRVPLNAGTVAGLIAGFVLFFAVPGFLLGVLALLLFFVADVAVYLVLRQQKVGLSDLSGQFTQFAQGLIHRKQQKVETGPGAVTLMDKKSTPVPLPEAGTPERGAYDAVQMMLTDPLYKNAERIEMTVAGDQALVRYVVDGVVYNGASMDRSHAGAAIHLLKQIARMDLNEKRKPQTGAMRVAIEGKRRDAQVETRGSASGEVISLQMDLKKRFELRLKDLGFAPEQLELVRAVVGEKQGIVLVAAPRQQGLTSLLYGLIREHDAFLTHINTVERAPQDADLEGITQNLLPATPAPGEELKLVNWLCSSEPDVILATQLEDPGSAVELINFAAKGKRVYVGLRAGNTLEAIEQWRKLVGDDRKAMKDVVLVVAGRVARKLCSACKVGYQPDPAMMRKLNMDPDQVGQLYQARTQPLVDAKGRTLACDFCADLRYKGRVGIYEVLYVDQEVRQALSAKASANQIKALFRKQKGRYLQEQALLFVEQGITSVQEVLRVLRMGEAPAAAPSKAVPAKAPVKRPTAQ